jgi:hypothetical protein
MSLKRFGWILVALFVLGGLSGIAGGLSPDSPSAFNGVTLAFAGDPDNVSDDTSADSPDHGPPPEPPPPSDNSEERGEVATVEILMQVALILGILF